jgi:tRNA threonylcarbamoyl adenosine modification protein (Sua5/YciO/YrdC/YwlC family)
MEIFTQTEVQLRFKEIVEHIRAGAVFIHPTDTIYGIGCNAMDEKAVAKVRRIKERPESPFSVWVPEKKWITENCFVHNVNELKKLPGPYTFVLHVKPHAVAKNVAPEKKTLGVRFPNHWFTRVVEAAGVPLITTSVNKAGERFMTDLENLDDDIETVVAFCIYEGEKQARPSKIINLAEGGVVER